MRAKDFDYSIVAVEGHDPKRPLLAPAAPHQICPGRSAAQPCSLGRLLNRQNGAIAPGQPHLLLSAVEYQGCAVAASVARPLPERPIVAVGKCPESACRFDLQLLVSSLGQRISPRQIVDHRRPMTWGGCGWDRLFPHRVSKVRLGKRSGGRLGRQFIASLSPASRQGNSIMSLPPGDSVNSVIMQAEELY